MYGALFGVGDHAIDKSSDLQSLGMGCFNPFMFNQVNNQIAH